MNLPDKVAAFTGAASGIGKNSVTFSSEGGAKVALAGPQHGVRANLIGLGFVRMPLVHVVGQHMVCFFRTGALLRSCRSAFHELAGIL
jgi:hypothetical protein